MKIKTSRVFFIVLFLGLFLMTLRPIADPDFWWHLKTGQLIVQAHAIPHADPFSFTKLNGVWITHEWLSELLIFGLFRLGGFSLLVIFFSMLITGAFLITYLRCPVNTRPYISGFILIFGAISTAPTWGVRPQMISLLITSLFLFLLDGYRKEGKLTFLLPLPFLTLVWVNLHAGYLLGLALIGIYIAGSLIEIFVAEFINKSKVLERPTLNSVLVLCGCLGICCLASLANPNGVNLLIYPFQTLVSPSMQQFIQEWFSPDFHQLIWQPFAFLILALIGVGMLSKKSIPPTNILLAILLGYAALHSMRNIPLFVIIVIPILSEQVSSMVHIPLDSRPTGKIFSYLVPILVLCIMALINLRFIQVRQAQPRTETENFPQAAADWILVNRPSGNLFNSYGWGGYLIWKLYPTYRVYIDGRADVYGDQFIYQYMTIYRAEPGWEDKLEAQNIRTVIVEPDSPLSNVLGNSLAWHIAYEDKSSVIYIR
jgi:hypothetical protein